LPEGLEETVTGNATAFLQRRAGPVSSCGDGIVVANHKRGAAVKRRGGEGGSGGNWGWEEPGGEYPDLKTSTFHSWVPRWGPHPGLQKGKKALVFLEGRSLYDGSL